MRLGFSRSRGTQDTLGSVCTAFNAAVRAALVAAGSPPPIAARTVVRLQAGDAELDDADVAALDSLTTPDALAAFAQLCAHTHANPHTHTHTSTGRDACVCAFARALARTRAHARTQAHTVVCTLKHARTRARTHAHTHARTHTRTRDPCDPCDSDAPKPKGLIHEGY